MPNRITHIEADFTRKRDATLMQIDSTLFWLSKITMEELSVMADRDADLIVETFNLLRSAHNQITGQVWTQETSEASS